MEKLENMLLLRKYIIGKSLEACNDFLMIIVV